MQRLSLSSSLSNKFLSQCFSSQTINLTQKDNEQATFLDKHYQEYDDEQLAFFLSQAIKFDLHRVMYSSTRDRLRAKLSNSKILQAYALYLNQPYTKGLVKNGESITHLNLSDEEMIRQINEQIEIMRDKFYLDVKDENARQQNRELLPTILYIVEHAKKFSEQGLAEKIDLLLSYISRIILSVDLFPLFENTRAPISLYQSASPYSLRKYCVSEISKPRKSHSNSSVFFSHLPKVDKTTDSAEIFSERKKMFAVLLEAYANEKTDKISGIALANLDICIQANNNKYAKIEKFKAETNAMVELYQNLFQHKDISVSNFF